jgi:hypothetical protein
MLVTPTSEGPRLPQRDNKALPLLTFYEGLEPRLLKRSMTLPKFDIYNREMTIADWFLGEFQDFQNAEMKCPVSVPSTRYLTRMSIIAEDALGADVARRAPAADVRAAITIDPVEGQAFAGRQDSRQRGGRPSNQTRVRFSQQDTERKLAFFYCSDPICLRSSNGFRLGARDVAKQHALDHYRDFCRLLGDVETNHEFVVVVWAVKHNVSHAALSDEMFAFLTRLPFADAHKWADRTRAFGLLLRGELRKTIAGLRWPFVVFDLTTIRTKKREIITIIGGTNSAHEVEHHVVDCRPVNSVRFGAMEQGKMINDTLAEFGVQRVYSWAGDGDSMNLLAGQLFTAGFFDRMRGAQMVIDLPHCIDLIFHACGDAMGWVLKHIQKHQSRWARSPKFRHWALAYWKNGEDDREVEQYRLTLANWYRA